MESILKTFQKILGQRFFVTDFGNRTLATNVGSSKPAKRIFSATPVDLYHSISLSIKKNTWCIDTFVLSKHRYNPNFGRTGKPNLPLVSLYLQSQDKVT